MPVRTSVETWRQRRIVSSRVLKKPLALTLSTIASPGTGPTSGTIAWPAGSRQ